MLQLSTAIKRLPFQLTVEDGSVVDLQVTQFTTRDSERMYELQKSIFDKNEKAESLTVLDIRDIDLARIVCSIKTLDNDYYWDGSLADFKALDFPNDLVNALSAEVGSLNPVIGDKSVASKKS
jgi:hypothetical protein